VLGQRITGLLGVPVAALEYLEAVPQMLVALERLDKGILAA
jgi:hypothetical protein